MKLLFVSSLYYPHIGGGAEIVLQTLTEGLCNRGHEVIVLTIGKDHGLTEETINGVRVIRSGIANFYWHDPQKRPSAWKRSLWHIRDSYNLSMANIVEKIIRQEKPDVVNTHSLVGWSSAVWQSIKRTEVPIVHALHDVYNFCPKTTMFRNNHYCTDQCSRCKLFRLPHRQLSENVDAVVGVSEFVLNIHLKHGFFPKSHIRRVIHNASNIKCAKQLPDANDSNIVRFGFLGALIPAKGVELLLEIFSKLSLNNTELWIGGKGHEEYEQNLRRYSSDRVRYLGFTLPDKFFPNIDVLVVPSLCQDTLPTVVFEALAHGVPVIGSRRGGIPEMIIDGQNGFLFEPDRPQELASLLERLAHNPEDIYALRTAAAASAKPFLDVDGWMNQYEIIFNELCQSAP